MKQIHISRRGASFALTLLAAFAAVSAYADHDGRMVVTMGNQASGNTLEVFRVAPDGSLSFDLSVSTGGMGTGTGLGNQGAIAYDEEAEILAAVNAGDNSFSLFTTERGVPELIGRYSSGGTRPVSITLKGKTVYVLNQGDATHASSVTGFALVLGGVLPWSESGLSEPFVNPAEIKFSPNGRSLVVTEKATNRLAVFNLNQWRKIDSATFINSSGSTPFGFDFDESGRLFVSEAAGGAPGGSSLSSYRRTWNGGLSVISGSVPNHQSAMCWAVVSPNGRFVLTTNTASGTISTYRIGNGGQLYFSANSAAMSGFAPIDAAFRNNGRSFYVLGVANHSIVTFRVAADGSVEAVDSDITLTGANGLAFIR